jgi:DNA-binding beta-propeller fold protein YncE
MKILFSLTVFIAAAAALMPPANAQSTDPNFTNNTIAQQIANMEALLGPGPYDVSGKMGPMPNGGNCTIKIVVASANDPSQYYTFTIPFVDDTKCKNYVLVKEADGTIQVVSKQQQSLQQTLDQLNQLGNYLSGKHDKEPHANAKPHPASQNSPPLRSVRAAAATTQSFPTILDLPLGPPLSAGTYVTSSDGCRPDQAYFLYRVNHFDNSVTRFDGCPMTLTTTIPLTATNPLQAALTPDNTTLIVTSYNQGITFIDTASNKVTKTLFVDPGVYPSGIAMRGDGAVAYITSLIDINPVVLVLDVANRAILGQIPMPVAYPHSALFSPDGTTALVTFPITNYVYVLDVLTSSISTAISVGSPFGVAYNRTGTRAYVSSRIFPSSIKVIDTGSYEIIDSYQINGDPGFVKLSPDGRFLSVMDVSSTNIYIIELATRTVTTIDTGLGGGGLTYLPSN